METLRVLFGEGIAHLYEVGYISTDLYQLMAFGDLIDEKQDARLRKFIGEKAVPINRYTNIVERRRTRAEILEVRGGSIELVIAVGGLAAAIIMPLVAVAVSERLRNDDIYIRFEVDPQDEALKRILDAHAQGEFGYSEDGLQVLLAILEERGYDVAVLSDNSFAITQLVDKYTQRIVRTVKKNR